MVQVFPCEFCETFKNTFYRTTLVAASVHYQLSHSNIDFKYTLFSEKIIICVELRYSQKFSDLSLNIIKLLLLSLKESSM